MEDICSDVESPPRPARPRAGMLPLRRAMTAERPEGPAGFRDAVKAGAFPHEPHQHQVPMTAGESGKLREALDAWRPVHQ